VKIVSAIVEKHPSTRETLCTAITDEPGFCAAAETAQNAEGLRIAESVHPDGILFALENSVQENKQTPAAPHAIMPGVAILALTSEYLMGNEQKLLV
jgi:hypothetical protein